MHSLGRGLLFPPPVILPLLSRWALFSPHLLLLASLAVHDVALLSSYGGESLSPVDNNNTNLKEFFLFFFIFCVCVCRIKHRVARGIWLTASFGSSVQRSRSCSWRMCFRTTDAASETGGGGGGWRMEGGGRPRVCFRDLALTSGSHLAPPASLRRCLYLLSGNC